MGIDEESVVTCRDRLVNKLKQLHRIIGSQQVIAETYLPGREFTVGVIGNEVPYVLPIICFPQEFNIRSHKVKMTEYKARSCFEILPPASPEAHTFFICKRLAGFYG
ncbi:MAG: hypothetical protein H0Z40_07290 [Desulfotomaculum sp.]|nr:hypothetical protein [Desulfotomaculum sp.]